MVRGSHRHRGPGFLAGIARPRPAQSNIGPSRVSGEQRRRARCRARAQSLGVAADWSVKRRAPAAACTASCARHHVVALRESGPAGSQQAHTLGKGGRQQVCTRSSAMQEGLCSEQGLHRTSSRGPLRTSSGECVRREVAQGLLGKKLTRSSERRGRGASSPDPAQAPTPRA